METDFLVIGAGIAGLAAVKYLVESNQNDFLIIDARDRIGGRVSSVDFAGCIFPSGPAFLHGVKGNPFADIAKELNLKAYPDPFEDLYSHTNLICRSSYDGTICTNEFRQALGKFNITCNDIYHQISGIGSQLEMSNHFFSYDNDEDLRTSLRKFGWNPCNAIERAAEALLVDISCGAPCSYQSTKGFLISDSVYKKDNERRDCYLLDGNAFVKCVESLAEKAQLFTKNKEKLLLEQVCTHIDYSLQDVVCVKLSGDKVIRCKHVIVTLPCHLLENSIVFQPKLPSIIIDYFSQIKYANYQRIFVEFDYVFWDDVPVIINVQNAPNLEEFPLDDPLHPSRCMIYWQNGHFLCKLAGLKNPPNVLIAHVSFDWASKISCMKREELEDLIKSIMEPMYNCKFQIKNLLITSWLDDKWARGSFAYSSPPLNKSIVESIKIPLAKRIHFAGDAYDIRYLGTTNCAYFTGIRAAKASVDYV